MYRIRAFILFLALTPAASGAEPLADAVKPFVEKGNLAGAVMLVADKDKVLAVETAGYSDVAAKTPIKPDALFWIASQSKAMTAAGLMILVDEGKLKLSDPVSKYIPEFADVTMAVKGKGSKKPAREITILDVLSHVSGLPFTSAAEKPTLDALPLKKAVLSYTKTPLRSEPGNRYAYSNAGINTAGRIIEIVSKMPYEEFLDKRLFAPLGMTDTTFWPSEEQVKRLAKSYKPGQDKTGLEELKIGQLQYPLTDHVHRYPMPAGGLFSTADDVSKFCRMLLNGGTLNGKRVLSEASVKEMTTRQTPEKLKESYGLGLSVGDNSFGHGGAFATNMSVDKNRGLVYVWMVQHAGFPGNGGQAQGAFQKAANENFGKKK